MILFDIPLKTPEEHLAADEVLLLSAEQNPLSLDYKTGILRMWELKTYCVVMGISGKVHEEVYTEVCSEKSIPILRRSSGGGTVLLGPGCLSYSILMPMQEDVCGERISQIYQHMLGKISKALCIGPYYVQMQGISDIAWGNKKISGNALVKKKKFFLLHGTILYNFDLKLIEKILPYPFQTPWYRQGRAHAEFVCNYPLTKKEIEEHIIGEFQVQSKRSTWHASEFSLWEETIQEKYQCTSWNLRR